MAEGLTVADVGGTAAGQGGTTGSAAGPSTTGTTTIGGGLGSGIEVPPDTVGKDLVFVCLRTSRGPISIPMTCGITYKGLQVTPYQGTITVTAADNDALTMTFTPTFQNGYLNFDIPNGLFPPKQFVSLYLVIKDENGNLLDADDIYILP